MGKSNGLLGFLSRGIWCPYFNESKTGFLSRVKNLIRIKTVIKLQIVRKKGPVASAPQKKKTNEPRKIAFFINDRKKAQKAGVSFSSDDLSRFIS